MIPLMTIIHLPLDKNDNTDRTQISDVCLVGVNCVEIENNECLGYGKND